MWHNGQSCFKNGSKKSVTRESVGSCECLEAFSFPATHRTETRFNVNDDPQTGGADALNMD